MDTPAALPVDVDGFRALVRRIGGLHFRACLDGAVLPGLPAAPPLDAEGVRRMIRDPRFRYMLGQDRLSRFWLREWGYHALLTTVALHSSWVNAAPLPVGMTQLVRQTGLSDRMVRATLGQAVATGDLVRLRCAQDARLLVFDLSPALAAALEQRNDAFATLIAEALGRDLAPLPPVARPPIRRLHCLMALTTGGPIGQPPRPELSRRSFTMLLADLVAEGPQPLAALVAAEASRLRVTQMTVRNTVRRAQEAGWVDLDAQGMVGLSAMARLRLRHWQIAMLTRWDLLIAARAALAQRPSLGVEVTEAAFAGTSAPAFEVA